MDKLTKLLFISVCMLFAGNAVAQATPVARINTLQLKNTPPVVNPAAVSRLGQVAIALPLTEEQVQAEIKVQRKKNDDVSNAIRKVDASFTRVNSTPATGNSCVDPDTTWNPRSGESFSCSGLTTCNARSSRWSKNRFNPCEAGVAIDSCIHSDECKTGSICDTGKQVCVRR
ncbi:MAG: hypothetical protein V4631_21435 [Pseudomonadota bacterium]